MDLILWRHAEALPGADDMVRPLSRRGEKQAKLAAAWLADHLPENTQILVSPAQRTRQTANALHRSYQVSEALAPDKNVDSVLTTVDWPNASGTVLVVGHQPTLGEIAVSLLDGFDGLIWTPSCASLCWIRAEKKDGAPEISLVTTFAPKE